VINSVAIEGPHRLKRKEITDAFAHGWRIDSLEPATIEFTTEPDGIRAWLLAATRINDSTDREHNQC
jgi:hypothetical protein